MQVDDLSHSVMIQILISSLVLPILQSLIPKRAISSPEQLTEPSPEICELPTLTQGDPAYLVPYDLIHP